MKEKIQKFREYLDYVERHYDNVQKAWDLINEKCKNKGFSFIYDDCKWWTIDDEVKNHDLSKLSMEEFTQYRQFFYPTKDEVKDKKLFLSAWEHHKENNVHHWQNWTVKHKGFADDVFMVMNLIDWIAMGFEFGDTARDYYEKNKKDIELPEYAIKVMYEIFDCIYPIIDCDCQCHDEELLYMCTPQCCQK